MTTATARAAGLDLNEAEMAKLKNLLLEQRNKPRK